MRTALEHKLCPNHVQSDRLARAAEPKAAEGSFLAALSVTGQHFNFDADNAHGPFIDEDREELATTL
jgi:hypothetical protein